MNKFLVLSLLLSGIATSSAHYPEDVLKHPDVYSLYECDKNANPKWSSSWLHKDKPTDKYTDWKWINEFSNLHNYKVYHFDAKKLYDLDHNEDGSYKKKDGTYIQINWTNPEKIGGTLYFDSCK